ncbi:MAG: VWA domain-containing protein [Terriglobales bacterium]
MPFLTRVRALALVVCPFVLAITTLAQAPPPAMENLLTNANAGPAPALPASETIRTRVDEVNVVFTVSDASGRFISHISLNDLRVLDNRRAPERISYFQQQSDLPLRVGVLVDLSDSITDRFAYEKKAAITFLQKVLRPQIDEAFLVGFASRVTLYHDFTSDIGALSNAVREMHAGGDTRLYDAIRFASAKLGSASGPALMRRAIILITDGEDTRSKTIMYDAIQSALHAETVIYALSSNDLTDGDYPPREAVLELITRPTGGGVLPAHSKSEIARAFDKVKEALRNQYAIGYKPADFKPDGSFRAIQIVPRHNKLRVQCRRGYFTPREEQASASHATAP